MKYKYIVGLLVALSLNNAFAAEEITAGDYQRIYLAFRCGGSREINAALANNQTFNHKDDKDIIRSSQTGLALRKAVIGLNAADLQAVVETNHEFFKTSLGISLVYGWTLNQFKEPVTPYYIGHYFSFDKLFQGLAGKMDDSNVVTFLRSAFTRGLSAVDADRWAFYDHMLYLPYAIEQVRLTGAVTARTSALSIYDVITIAHRTKEEAKSEKARVPGRAAHLDDLSEAARIECEICDFVNLQKFIVAKSEFHGRIESNLLATFQSLPADTIEDYVFMGQPLKVHMPLFRGVTEVEAGPFVMRVPVTVKCKYEGLDSVADVATNITAMVAFKADTLTLQQFEKIIRVAVTGDIDGIDEHTPGYKMLLPYLNYKRDYLGTLDHTDVDIDKLVAEQDLSGFLSRIPTGEHDAAKSELVGKSIKELAIAVRDELLVADNAKKRAAAEAAEEERVKIATLLKEQQEKQARVALHNADIKNAFNRIIDAQKTRHSSMKLNGLEKKSLMNLIKHLEIEVKDVKGGAQRATLLRNITTNGSLTGPLGGFNDNGRFLLSLYDEISELQYDGSAPYKATKVT